jgi:REP element-mobilizing transposase RayT
MRRRKSLTDEVERAAKQAIEECCQNYGFDVLDLDLDINRVHWFVSTPRMGPREESSGCSRARAHD